MGPLQLQGWAPWEMQPMGHQGGHWALLVLPVTVMLTKKRILCLSLSECAGSQHRVKPLIPILPLEQDSLHPLTPFPHVPSV